MSVFNSSDEWRILIHNHSFMHARLQSQRLNSCVSKQITTLTAQNKQFTKLQILNAARTKQQNHINFQLNALAGHVRHHPLDGYMLSKCSCSVTVSIFLVDYSRNITSYYVSSKIITFCSVLNFHMIW